MASKRCTKCGVEKPLEAFYGPRHRLGHGATANQCKECHRTERYGPPVEPVSVAPNKQCSNCKAVKSREDFGNCRSSSDGKQSQCRVCQHGRRRHVTPEQHRANNLRKLYGITLADYTRMLDDQDRGCAICGSVTPGRKEKHFHVDHDHVTGRVRGLLCERCNVGIGYFGSPDHLDKAADYLRRKG